MKEICKGCNLEMLAHMKCKGCNVIRKESCFFIAVKEVRQCPCVECLVKPMCSPNGSCDKRNDLAGEISTRKAKEIIDKNPDIREL